MSTSQPGLSEKVMKTPESLIWGTGEMADLTRAFDWSRTSLGRVESWPDVLLVTVNILLGSRHPMFLFWGAELIQFYNDACRPSLGSERHPRTLGEGGRQSWPEIWDAIGPQLEAVMTRGEASWNEDHLLPLCRNGKLEESYWTYSYSPVRDVDGTIRGVLTTCSETTGRVVAEREQVRLKGLTAASEERARLALRAANGVGTWDWDIAADLVYTDSRFASINGLDREHAAHGLPIADFVRNVHPEDLPEVDRRMKQSVHTGEEYTAEYRLLQPDGNTRWVLARGRCSFAKDGTPLRFPGVTVDITQRKENEELLKSKGEALRLSTERLHLSQEAGRVSCWEWDVSTGNFIWDQGSLWTYGRPLSEMVHFNSILQFLHEDDRGRLLEDLKPAIEGRGEYRSQFRVFWPDGSMHWLDGRGWPSIWHGRQSPEDYWDQHQCDGSKALGRNVDSKREIGCSRPVGIEYCP